ncbi:MAG: hypothetical protein JWM32_2913 [Verrucomicrobia bacterium]|nr:hypothetical protein [Verrucomicrobiota bacterium]
MLTDLRFALRQLIKAPGFTAAAVLTLAVGIGACTSIFSVVNSVLIQPLPYPHSERLVVLTEAIRKTTRTQMSPATFVALQDQAEGFESIAAWDFRSYNITGQGDPFRVYAQNSTANLFRVLGVQPLLGRTFLQEEGVEGKTNVLILSYKLWKGRFGSRADIVGQTLLLDEQPFTVVGVMPESFQFAPQSDLFTPAAFSAASHGDFNRHLAVLARLKPGISREAVSAGLEVVSSNLAKSTPAIYKDVSVNVVPLLEARVGGIQQMSFFLLGAVGCLLLIACTNIANLLLARASSRRKEIAVRTALGASRSRIVRQLLSESLMLALLGGMLGLLLGRWGLDAIIAFLPAGFPRLDEITMDRGVLGFATILTLVTGMIFGLVPALQASRVDVIGSLKDGGRGNSAGAGANRLRALLVVTEVALAFILLTGAGLFFRSMLKAQDNEVGFESKTTYGNVLLLSAKKYPTPAQRTAAIDQLVERISAVPGVVVVTFTNHTSPSGGAPMGPFAIGGRPPIERAQQPTCFYYAVTPDYFKTFLIPVRQGRTFNARDGASAPRVALINEELALKYFPAENPVGKQITVFTNGVPVPREIVGVVANVRQSSLFLPMQPQVYEPYAQVPELSTTLTVRSPGPLQVRALIAAVHAVDPDLPLDTMYPMAGGLNQSLAAYRIAIVLFGVFSVVALFLAVLGIYGVMAYNVTQRTSEIGIRMALGAQRADVLKLILSHGARQVVLGLAIGLAGSLAVARLLASMLYETSPGDPFTLACIIAILSSAALLATWLPALRASRVDPLVALRAE